MKKKNIRLAIVGYGKPCSADGSTCGRGGGLFRSAVKQLEGIIPAAVCDTDRACLKQAKKDFPKSKLYSDFDKMIKDTPIDAVIIGTPAHLHTELAIKALQHNIHVLSEIPSVHTIAEAGLLWKAHLKSKALYMTGANANMVGWIDTALDLKKRGLLGDPYYIEAAYIHDCREYWEATPWRKKLFPILYCTHSLGPVLRLLDEDLEWVSCFDTGSHINKEEGQHDAMSAQFRTKSNVVVQLLTTFICNAPISCQHNYRFFTTKGAFERTRGYCIGPPPHTDQQRTLFYSTELYGYKNWIELPIDAYSRPEYAAHKEGGHGGLDYVMLAAFFKAIREGGPSPISLKEGLRMTLPGIYAAESARRGGELTRIRYPWSAKL